MSFPRIEEAINLALGIFPDGDYWKAVFELRKKRGIDGDRTRNDPFNDIFQFAHQPMEELAANGQRQTKVLPFSTVAMTSDHWAVVLLLYVIAQPDYWKTPSQVASSLWHLLEPFREEGKLMYHDKIGNFSEDTMKYIAQTAMGTRSNQFIANPAECICSMLTFLEELGQSPGFYDDAKEKVTKSLNAEPRASEYQAELRILQQQQ